MSLILIALIFSNVSFGATPCSRLMLKAGLYAQKDLSHESATLQYLQYIKHFVDHGDLGLEELKILRAFSKIPNLVDLFEGKIKEGYVYQEHLEILRPLVDQGRYNEFLDGLIDTHTKERNLKSQAHKDTESVTGFFMIPKKFPTQIDSTSSNFNFGGEHPYIFKEHHRSVTNLETGNQVNIDLDKDFKFEDFSWHVISGKTYFLAKLDKSGASISEHAEKYKVFDPETGNLIVQTDAKYTFGSPTLLKAQNGTVQLGWIEAFYDAKDQTRENIVFIKSVGSEEKQRITLDPEFALTNVGFTQLPDGQTLLRHVIGAASGMADLQFLDISAGGKELFTFPGVISTDSVNVEKLSDNEFIILAYGRGAFQELRAHRAKANSKWELTASSIIAPHSQTFISAQMPDKSVFHFSSQYGHSLEVFEGIKSKDSFPEIGPVVRVLTRPNGTPLVVAVEQSSVVVPGRAGKLFLIDPLDNFSITSVDLAPLSKSWNYIFYQTVKMFPDGSIIAYFSVQNAGAGQQIIPVQLYGSYKPGDFK
jgi:hypothetical protein